MGQTLYPGPPWTLWKEGQFCVSDVLDTASIQDISAGGKWIPDGHADQASPRLSPIMDNPKHTRHSHKSWLAAKKKKKR